MITKKIPIFLFVFVVLLSVAACNSTPVTKSSQTIIVPTLTPITKTPAPLPTIELLSASTMTALPTRTPLPASLPKFLLDSYIVLFNTDNNLYFQDGNSSPIKLAERISNPFSFSKLSDDNQKVVFQKDNKNIYSINTDGTQEKIIVPNNWLAALEAGTKLDNLSFVPETHLLFFEAVLCKEKSASSLCSSTIFLIDTDTGNIKKLGDFGLVRQESNLARNIEISPNGKMIAIGTMDGLKLFTLDGNMVRENILPFMPSKPDMPFPSLFWLPDSSGLVVILPDKNRPDPFYVDGMAPAYTIWRYKLDDNSTTRIPFDLPMAGTFEVSPDGNWIVYGGISPAATELYLGNLMDGSTKIFGNDLRRNFAWSPDSKHFIHGGEVVISFDKPPLYGGAGPAWVDADHFTYIDIPENNPLIQKERILIGEIRGDEVYYYELGLPSLGLMTIKPKQ